MKTLLLMELILQPILHQIVTALLGWILEKVFLFQFQELNISPIIDGKLPQIIWKEQLLRHLQMESPMNNWQLLIKLFMLDGILSFQHQLINLDLFVFVIIQCHNACLHSFKFMELSIMILLSQISSVLLLLLNLQMDLILLPSIMQFNIDLIQLQLLILSLL